MKGLKLDNIFEIELQQEHSYDDYKKDTLRLEEIDKNDIKSINRDEEHSVILNNSTYLNRKNSNARIMPDVRMLRGSSFRNNLYPITLAKSYKANDNNNPFIFSLSEFQPISFLNGQDKFGLNKKTKQLESPSPTFIEYNDFLYLITPLTKETIFTGVRKDDKTGLVLTDKSISSKFKGIVGKIMKSIIMSIFTRKPVSLPVKIFEPKSTLHRITESWGLANEFLIKANEHNNNPLERLKYVMSFAIGGLYISTKPLKPFNPILGETFQAKIDKDTSIYVEHISHYPTISRFLMTDNKNRFRFHGFYDFNSNPKSFGARLIVMQKGPNVCEFENKESVTYTLPKVKLLNCKSEEERSIHNTGKMIFSDFKNGLKAIVTFGKTKKKVNEIHGFIRKFKFPNDYKFNADEEIKYAKSDGIEKDVVCRVKGDWLEYLDFDEKTYWHVDKFVPRQIMPIEYPLPSDGRFREDLIWLFRGFYSLNEKEKNLFEDYSQQWKLIMELTQRNDRELRKNYLS